MIALMGGLGYTSGPRSYANRLTERKNMYASGVLGVSMILALYSSLFDDSYLMSLLFCIMMLNAVLYFFCNTSAISMSNLKWICS
mmetsp:Transcript_14546/g.19743  ORF Transcript_14546/g.19743 Transcript_14546/m.19743 type:complete len:85 (+) Transcript_14546:516-770(+)